MAVFIENDAMYSQWTKDAPFGRDNCIQPQNEAVELPLSPAAQCRKNASIKLCIAIKQSQTLVVVAPDSPVMGIRRIGSFKI